MKSLNGLSPVGVIGVATVIALGMPDMSEACSVCFGGVDSPMTKGMNNGILSLLGILGVVQAGFIALFIRLRRRSRRQEKSTERIRLIDGGAR